MRKSLKDNNISILESKAQLGWPPTIHRTFDTMAWPRSVTCLHGRPSSSRSHFIILPPSLPVFGLAWQIKGPLAHLRRSAIMSSATSARSSGPKTIQIGTEKTFWTTSCRRVPRGATNCYGQYCKLRSTTDVRSVDLSAP